MDLLTFFTCSVASHTSRVEAELSSSRVPSLNYLEKENDKKLYNWYSAWLFRDADKVALNIVLILSGFMQYSTDWDYPDGWWVTAAHSIREKTLAPLRQFLLDPERSGEYFVDGKKYARAALRCFRQLYDSRFGFRSLSFFYHLTSQLQTDFFIRGRDCCSINYYRNTTFKCYCHTGACGFPHRKYDQKSTIAQVECQTQRQNGSFAKCNPGLSQGGLSSGQILKYCTDNVLNNSAQMMVQSIQVNKRLTIIIYIIYDSEHLIEGSLVYYQDSTASPSNC